MAKFYSELDDKLIQFIELQKIFFVATAPDSGRINLSPKGMDTFSVVSKNTIAYLDLTGSGNETAAHLQQNPRMTIMFCSFDKSPMILRLYGNAEIIKKDSTHWPAWISQFHTYPGARQIFVLNISSLQTSCGYAVPLAESITERDTLKNWAENKGEQGIAEYWAEKNQFSIDNLPTHIMEKDKS